MEATDEGLMAAYRDGDAGAFDALYARHRGPLYRYVLRGVRSAPIAEELYQDIWIRVIEARLRYSPRAKFTTWLYTIAHNRLVDHWRRKELVAAPAEEAGEVPAGVEAAPDRRAEGRQALLRLSGAIEALPLAQREAFLLHEEAGMTASEIGAATGSDPEAVKSRLRYAYAKLRAAVGDEAGDD